MWPVLSSLLLLAGAASCSADGARDNTVRCARDESCDLICSVCYDVMADSPEQKDELRSYVTENIFRTECSAQALTLSIGKALLCSQCCKGCGVMLRQVLANYQDDEISALLTRELFKTIDSLPLEKLSKILYSVNFTRNEYNRLVEKVASSEFSQLRDAVTNYVVSAYDNDIQDYCKYLESEYAIYVPNEVYRILVNRCIAAIDLSISQILAISKRLVQRPYADEAEKRKSIMYFINTLAMSPTVQLSFGDACEFISSLLNDEIRVNVSDVLNKDGLVCTVDASEMPGIFKRHLGMCVGDEPSMNRIVWLYLACLHKLDSEQVQRIKQDVKECIAATDGAGEEDNIVRKGMKALYSQLAKNSLKVNEAIEKIQNASGRLSTFTEAKFLEEMTENGVIRTIVCANCEDRMLLLRSIHDNFGSIFFRMIYLILPESHASIEMDLIYLQSFLSCNLSYSNLLIYIMPLARRRYFGYEMLVKMLDIFAEANNYQISSPLIRKLPDDFFLLGVTDSQKIPLVTWLLLTADHKGLFSGLSKEESKALFKTFVDAKLLLSIAFLQKAFDGGIEYKRIVKKNAGHILSDCFRLPLIEWEYAMHCYTKNYVFDVWCDNISFYVEPLFEEMKFDMFMTRFAHFIVSVCGSEYFANNVSAAEVAKLIRIMLKQGNGILLKCMDSLFAKMRSVEHRIALKIQLFKTIIAYQLTDGDITALNAMGFKLGLVDSRPAYEMGDGSMKIIDLDNLGDLVGTVKTVNGHRLLEMILRSKSVI